MILGLDIGGANLKAAHLQGVACSLPFALWKEPARLADRLRELLDQMPPATTLAVTMTGELCDCFAGKRAGVEAILTAVEISAGLRTIHVWTTQGRFVDLAEARDRPLETAAANWLALASCVARELTASRPGLLIDIGSTTTDIIPLLAGNAHPTGHTDPQRLRSKELVYCGVRRTPLCALLGLSAAAEWFATTLDIYLTLGLIAEDGDNRDTADGRPATRAAAHSRLAHMLCADAETCSPDESRRLAERAMQTQIDALCEAASQVVRQMPERPGTVVVSGSGEFLARRVVQELEVRGILASERILSLSEEWGPSLSEAACAFALVRLRDSQKNNT